MTQFLLNYLSERLKNPCSKVCYEDIIDAIHREINKRLLAFFAMEEAIAYCICVYKKYFVSELASFASWVLCSVRFGQKMTVA